MLASGFYLVVQLSFFRSIFYFSNNLDIYTQTWKLYIPQGNFDTDNMPIYGYQVFFYENDPAGMSPASGFSKRPGHPGFNRWSGKFFQVIFNFFK